jgi:hypothetical protein
LLAAAGTNMNPKSLALAGGTLSWTRDDQASPTFNKRTLIVNAEGQPAGEAPRRYLVA